MALIDLYYKIYIPHTPCPRENISYPYRVRIPDIEERMEFETMLEKDGFKRVNDDEGKELVFINFTLRRFGNADEQDNCAYIIPKQDYSKDEFMEKIYIPFMTNAFTRAMLSNNYLQSAALHLANAENALIAGSDKYDQNIIGEMNKAIEDDLIQLQKSRIPILEKVNDYSIEIREGADPSSYFLFSPVRDVYMGGTSISDDDVDLMACEFSIEEDYIGCFLRYFLEKHFDPELIYNKKRMEVVEEQDENIFQWWLINNFYTYESIEEMCREILDVADALTHDFYDQELDEIKKYFSIYYMTYDWDEDREKGNTEEVLRKHRYPVIDFYLRFVYRIRRMMRDYQETKLIAISGP